jgi:hypothetical protein
MNDVRMIDNTKIQRSFDLLSETVLRVKSERDALLEACRAIAKLDNGDAIFVWNHAKEFEMLHAAIAKAEGR